MTTADLVRAIICRGVGDSGSSWNKNHAIWKFLIKVSGSMQLAHLQHGKAIRQIRSFNKAFLSVISGPRLHLAYFFSLLSFFCLPKDGFVLRGVLIGKINSSYRYSNRGSSSLP